MPEYDPITAPDPVWWLGLDESDRHDLIREYHDLSRATVPNRELHTAFHAIVETQAAMGDQLPVARTLARLQAEGLDRHEAIHAIGSVLAEGIFKVVKGHTRSGNPDDAYAAALEKLNADTWRHAR